MAWWCRWETLSAVGSWPDSALNLRTEARRRQNECPTWFFVVPAQTRACPTLSPDAIGQTAGPGGDRTGRLLRRDAARRRIAAAYLRRSGRGFPDLCDEPQRHRTAHARAVGGSHQDDRGAEPAAGPLRGAAGRDGLSQRSGAHRRRAPAAQSGTKRRDGTDHAPGVGRYDRSAAGIGHQGPGRVPASRTGGTLPRARHLARRAGTASPARGVSRTRLLLVGSAFLRAIQRFIRDDRDQTVYEVRDDLGGPPRKTPGLRIAHDRTCFNPVRVL